MFQKNNMMLKRLIPQNFIKFRPLETLTDALQLHGEWKSLFRSDTMNDMPYDDAYDGPEPPPDEAPKGELAVVIDVPESTQSRRLLPERLYSENCRAIKLEEITYEMLVGFLEEYEKTGLWEISANRVGLNGRVLERLAKLDDRFKIMCEDRKKTYADNLQVELHRRAVLGWDEPQFNHKTGVQIGVVRKYDSRLLELMIKRHVPEYNEKLDVTVSQQVGVLVVPIRAKTTEEWEKMVGNAVTTDDRPKQIESKVLDSKPNPV